jgi:acetoin utilization deacetylase AcuC-like enzyme
MARELEVIVPKSHAGHRPFDSHPERPERIDLVVKGLSRAGIRALVLDPPRRSRKALYRVHDPDYVAYIERISRGARYIDSDTYVTQHSFQAALDAASSAIEAAERILAGGKLSIALPRPPGHHAGRYGRALGAPTQGFCIFNNAALASVRLLDEGLYPHAIIDIDIHHGNGTQEIFWRDPRVIHIDLHDSSIYPGTGWHTEVGGGDGAGTKINIPLIPGSRDPEYIYSWIDVVEPAIEHFKPRVIIISAGFDAHKGEDMGYVRLSNRLYRWLGIRIRSIASKLNARGIIVILEGGYGSGLYEGAPEFILGLLGEGGEDLGRLYDRARNEARDITRSVKRVINSYYNIYS